MFGRPRNICPRFSRALAVGGWLCLPAICAAAKIGPATTIGAITSSSLREVSGIVDGRANSGVFWVHNDSGDSARFYGIKHDGALLGTYTMSGAAATDWEDVAMGPKGDGGNFLYFADIGDNATARSSIDVYRVTEPTSIGSTTILPAEYSRARLQYPGGARNAEALFVDPLTNELFIVTKEGTTRLFSAPSTVFDSAGVATLTPHGNVTSAISTVTAADISPDGRYLLVRSTSAGRLYVRGAGQSVAEALQGPGLAFALGAESQGEAIAWSADGGGFYTTSEFSGGSSAPIHRYWFADQGLGDFDNDGEIDGDDLAVWLTSYGNGVGGDADADGDSDGVDFLTWQRRLTGPRTILPTSVAEPQSEWLVLVGSSLVASCLRGKRPRRRGRRC
jgi:hypothetical protein